jgi:RNA recognition motif-containing protein
VNIYIGNIPKTTNEQDIRAAFEAYGEVGEVKFVNDKFTHEPRGFGFAEMPVKWEARLAIKKLDGKELGGSRLIINEAGDRVKRSVFTFGKEFFHRF